MTRIVLLLAAVASFSCARNGHRTVETKPGVLYWEYEVKDGIPDGRSRTYYADGSIHTESSFLRAMKHGLFTEYAPNGDVIKRVFFWYDVLVWATYSDDVPPPQLLAELAKHSDQVTIRRLFGGRERLAPPRPFVAFDYRAPVASFVSSDRHVRSDTRIEFQFGAGGNTSRAFAARHYSLFGQWQPSNLGAFFQFDSSYVDSASTSETLQGRQTLEGGAVYSTSGDYGRVGMRLSAAVPVRHENVEGYFATAATSYQRPADAVLSLPATFAIRGSSSWILQRHRWLVQSDIGLDAAVGGLPGRTPVFGRFNTSLGVGIHSAVALIELSNTIQLNASENRLQSIGLGAAFGGRGIRVKCLVARTTGAFWALSLGSEYAF